MKRFGWAAVLLFVAAPSPNAQQAKNDGIIWATSWDDAVAEATDRNVPIYVSLHKDN